MKSKGNKYLRIVWMAFKILMAVALVIAVLLRFEIIGAPIANMSFRYSDEKLLAQFNDQDKIPTIKYLKTNDRTIRYLSINNKSDSPYVIFIHGAPGSLSDYHQYFKDPQIIDNLNLISIDRPGFGFSDFGDAETSLAAQASAIRSVVLKECKNNMILVIGHSYGGPIAVKMAMDNPDAYRAIMLLAPALDPQNEKEIKMAALPNLPVIRWLTPTAIRVATDEKNSHILELEKIEQDYHLIGVPVFHFHGNKDSLVPYENLNFSKRKIDAKLLEPIALKGVDHFLPWSHYDLIKQYILEITSGF